MRATCEAKDLIFAFYAMYNFKNLYKFSKNPYYMHVDRKTLEHVAEIARLKLTEEEIQKFLPQLQEAISNFSHLKEINTDNIKPSFQPVELRNSLHEDKEQKCLYQEEALSLTKHKKDGYFKGPKVV